MDSAPVDCSYLLVARNGQRVELLAKPGVRQRREGEPQVESVIE
jgi:hypothetical protein